MAGLAILAFDSWYFVAVSLTSAILLLLYWATTSTDIERIKGIPEIPGALPILGHLKLLGADHASACEKLWHEYKYPTFQLRLGNTRAVVFNSFEDCKRIFVSNSSATIDRPKLYTFHGVISSTQGFTVGSSPWDDSCRRRRKAAAATLSQGAIRNYFDMFDLESFCLLQDLTRQSCGGQAEFNPRPAIQRYALSTSLTLNYGLRMDSMYDDMLAEILEVGSAISLLRSASENYQDYIPALRYLPNNEKNRRGKDLRDRRDKYLNQLLSTARECVRQGTDKPCVSSGVIRDEESNLTTAEVGSICLSVISGGFESIPGALTSCIGTLSTREGQNIQDQAYDDINRYYPTIHDAWNASFQEEKVPFINALVKETLRYYSVFGMIPPRRTISDVEWNGAIIPAKTMILVNAQAANHDESHFGPTARVFDPARWLDASSPTPQERPATGIQHLSYGAGSRDCVGKAVGNRLLYAALVRLLSTFRIEASEKHPPNTDCVEFNSAKSAMVAIPKHFHVRLIPRDLGGLEEVLKEAEERTRESYRN